MAPPALCRSRFCVVNTTPGYKMFDFSWSEFLVVIVVALIAIGPKQLPDVLYGLGKIMRRLQYMRYALTRQFDDFMDHNELRQSALNPRVVNTDHLDEVGHDETHPPHTPPVIAHNPDDPAPDKS